MQKAESLLQIPAVNIQDVVKPLFNNIAGFI